MKNAKEYFNVTACTNPAHLFSLGSFIGKWQWSSDGVWSTITSRDTELTHWFHIGTVRDMSGSTALELVVWRLHLIIGKRK